MFSYWEQPKVIQKIINWFIPTKDTWSIHATKNAWCDWVFDIKPFVKDEAITGGSNTIIDTYFMQIIGHPADVGDQIDMHVSTVKPAYHHAVCVDFKPDPSGFGHVYVEQNTQMQGWFCPVFDVMFGYIPEKVYITFMPG